MKSEYQTRMVDSFGGRCLVPIVCAENSFHEHFQGRELKFGKYEHISRKLLNGRSRNQG